MEGDFTCIQELRDCYLKSRGKPLRDMVLPDYVNGNMAESLEQYCKRHPVTDEIRECYTRVLEDSLKYGDIYTYAYAYYGGNEIVACDWKKSEQAFLHGFDPDKDPSQGCERCANSLGYIYASDRLGKPDYKKAFMCFSYAVEQGVIEAAYKLSDLHRKGLGAERNRKNREDSERVVSKHGQEV